MLTKSGLRVGIGLPQTWPDGAIDRAYLHDYVQAADDTGYDDFWLTEGILSPNFYLEPVSLLTYAAALTTRIRLGVSVIILNMRNPVQLAKEIASLDQLSHGRVTVGVGLGGARNYEAFGVDPERRVARFIEAVKVMKALWTEENATLAGDFWRLDGARMQPKTVQKPHPPLWFGAHSPPALRRSVRYADGWMGAGSTPEPEFYPEIRQVRAYMQEMGRDSSSFVLSKRVYIAVEDDAAKAREKLSAALAYQYGGTPESQAQRGMAATPEQAIQTLTKMRDEGLQHIALQTCYGHWDQMKILTEKVVPYL